MQFPCRLAFVCAFCLAFASTAWAYQGQIQVLSQGQSDITVAPGGIFDVDVVVTADTPFWHVDFYLTSGGPSFPFMAVGITFAPCGDCFTFPPMLPAPLPMDPNNRALVMTFPDYLTTGKMATMTIAVNPGISGTFLIQAQGTLLGDLDEIPVTVNIPLTVNVGIPNPELLHPPVPMTFSYTATASTECGLTNVVQDGPANSVGSCYYCGGPSWPSSSSSWVEMATIASGQIRGLTSFQGQPGGCEEWMCMEWSPEWDCLRWEPFLLPMPAPSADGSIVGIIEIGSSADYPAGTPLELDLQVLAGQCGIGTYDFKASRGGTVIGQVVSGTPTQIACLVFAGETLSFEMAGSSSPYYGDYDDYDCDYAFYAVLRSPVVVSAVSRREHGNAGTFDLDVLAEGAVESRQDGPLQLVVTFDQTVEGAGGLDPADVSLSSGTVSGVSLGTDQKTLTIDLSGATNGTPLTVGFPGIQSPEGAVVTGTLCFGVLQGDVDGNRWVNAFDLTKARAHMESMLTADSFRSDHNVDGVIDSLDLQAIRPTLGTQVGLCE